jgi:hypothetical protein
MLVGMEFCTNITVLPLSRYNLQLTFTLATKPGECPADEDTSNCEHSCREDIDCPGSEKCCYNGCAYRCRGATTAVEQPAEPITRRPPVQEPVPGPSGIKYKLKNWTKFLKT